jgi:HK97 family phage prohead protease
MQNQMKQTRITTKESGQSIRAELDTEGKRFFVGYAAVYNSRSRLIFEQKRIFNEIMEPGCFNRVLADPKIDVILTLNHEKIYNLGRTSSGNLTLESDNIGLKFRASVPDTNLGNDTWEMIKRGDYTDCSFSFSVNPSGEVWEREGMGELIHRVKDVSDLYDVAICTLRGAYEETIVDVELAMRMDKELDKEKLKELEDLEAARKVNKAEQLQRDQEHRKAVFNSLKG